MKWDWVAISPPIEMTEANLTITASNSLHDDKASNWKHKLKNIIDDSEEALNKTMHTAGEEGFNINFEFNDDVPRRIDGFVIKSANDVPIRDPTAVTVEWDL